MRLRAFTIPTDSHLPEDIFYRVYLTSSDGAFSNIATRDIYPLILAETPPATDPTQTPIPTANEVEGNATITPTPNLSPAPTVTLTPAPTQQPIQSTDIYLPFLRMRK